MPHFRAVALALFTASISVGGQVDYERDIKPLLQEKCSACHGALDQAAGLRLDAGVLIHQGGDSGAAIIQGEAASSLLIERVSTADIDERMPPEGEGEPLTTEQLGLLENWINEGATSPENETIPLDPREHWAFQRLSRPEVPLVDHGDSLGNPVDAFISHQYAANNVTPVQGADRRTLIRRLYLDLVGLPPTRQQVQEFIQDESPSAYARLVNQLLDSPQYGERWGRHWMDVWRYSDWSGYKNQLRGSQRHIWRWRDWIVQSLNQDKGYDQMILEMLAGDEIAGDDLSVLPATGFLARNFHNSNRNIWLDATVEHTAKAFLGLTINCARCHDHKYDPIAQSEYYAMRAIFEPHHVRTERVAGQPDLMKDGVPRVFDTKPDAKTFLYVRGNEKHFDENAPIDAGIPAVFQQTFNIQPVSLPRLAVFPSLRPYIESEDVTRAKAQVAKARAELAKDSSELAKLKLESVSANLKSLEARWQADKAKHRQDSQDSTRDLKTLVRQAAKAEQASRVAAAKLELAEKQAKWMTAQTEAKSDDEELKSAAQKAKAAVSEATKKLEKAETEALTETDAYTPVGPVYPRQSTGRRLTLARWITDPDNPLTARVAINHLWMRHFGEPLVSNPFDFGLRSPRPVHAGLLDWLATELMDHQWSMKHIHRLLVLSRTYQLSSQSLHDHTATNAAIDPDNRLFWKFNVQRLDAEVIRDSVLHVADDLDTTIGGADIDHNQGENVARRSLYFRHAYEKQMTMLVLFDAAGPNECYRRSESIIPQQALTLANSPLALSQSRRLAHLLWDEVCLDGEFCLDPEARQADAQKRFIQGAFQQVLARMPSGDEIKACRTFLFRQATVLASPEKLSEFAGKTVASTSASKDPAMRARENLVHVLINHNDFVTIR